MGSLSGKPLSRSIAPASISQLASAVVVLQDVAERAVQHARLAEAQGGGVLSSSFAASAGLDADQLDRGVVHERIEQAGRVAAAADAGHHHVGQPTHLIETLLPRFL